MEHYRSLGYLEDGVFAQNLAQRLHETKNYAKRRIAQELRAKGVEQQTVQEVLETLPPDEAALRRSLEKKYRTVDWSDAVQRRRAVRALLRDGLHLKAFDLGKAFDIDHAADIAKAGQFLRETS